MQDSNSQGNKMRYERFEQLPVWQAAIELAATGLRADLVKLKAEAESISKQLGAWIRSLRDSDRKGERHVSEKTRRADRAAQDRREFLEELERIRESGIQDSTFKIQD
jgi:hypothetical protein